MSAGGGRGAAWAALAASALPMMAAAPWTGAAEKGGAPTAAPASGPGARAGGRTCASAPRRIELEATGRAPGASGFVDLRFASSPYGVAVAEDGSYRYRVEVHVASVPPSAAGGGTLTAWAATPDLDRHVKLGALGGDGAARGEVAWNKFLVFVTAEPTPTTERWRGPVLMTATSPAGRMHTMAGHGIYRQHGIGC